MSITPLNQLSRPDWPLGNTQSQAVHRCLGFVETERVVYFSPQLEG